MMSNHVEDFRYNMQRVCNLQDMCEYCPYHYKHPVNIGINVINASGCFKDDLINYISYKADKHG